MKKPQLIDMFRDLASEIAERDLSFVQEDAAIAELGIDSLAMLELVGTLERQLRVRVPDEKLVGLTTVRELLQVVQSGLSQSSLDEGVAA